MIRLQFIVDESSCEIKNVKQAILYRIVNTRVLNLKNRIENVQACYVIHGAEPPNLNKELRLFFLRKNRSGRVFEIISHGVLKPASCHHCFL